MSVRAKHPPTRAVVLAAGFGTRMRPLTEVVPKPLLPLWGVPAIEHVLRLLERWGVRHTLMNLHHESGMLLDYARSRRSGGMTLDLSHEPDILGTGGVLQRASWFLDDRPFWMVNADIAADLDPAPLLQALRDPNVAAALWLHPERGPRTVEVNDGLITNFRSERPGAEGTCTFCGLQLVRPSTVKFIPEGFSSIVAAYERARKAGRHIAGVVVPGAFWRDLGQPDDYLDAHAELLQRHRKKGAGSILVDPATLRRSNALRRKGVRIDGFAAIGERVSVAEGARLNRCVLWPDARIDGRAVLSRAMVASGVRVQGEASHILMRASDVLSEGERRALARCGWHHEQVVAECLPPRGSARSFVRLHLGRRSIMLVRYRVERRENRRYAGHARFLAGLGVRVPGVLADEPRHRFTLIEDLGPCSLERVVDDGAGPRRLRNLYRRVLVLAHTLHQDGARAARQAKLRLMPRFSPSLYRWERKYFADHFLTGTLEFGPDLIDEMLKDLRRAARRLRDANQVLLHRDLQSANVLVKGREVGLIDFQGMRFGPAAYDLASLLCDPYVALSPQLRAELIGFYAALSPAARHATRLFAWAAVQRLAQALGAYGRLVRLPGGDVYRRHMLSAVRMMREMLPETGISMHSLETGLETAEELLKKDEVKPR